MALGSPTWLVPGAAMFAALALAGCASAPPSGSAEACAYVKQADLPVSVLNGIPVVTLTIAGAPAKLAMDTGANHTTLFDPIVDRLDLQKNPALTYTVNGVNGLSTRQSVFARDLQLGTIKLGSPVVGVAPTLGASPYDGLLGTDLLSQFDIDYDARRRFVTLYHWRDCPDGKPAWDTAFRSVPITYSAATKGLVRIPFALADEPLSAILDSGAAGTFLTRSAALRAGFAPDAFVADRTINASGVGTERVGVVVHRFPSVTVAGQQFHDLPLAVRGEASLTNIGDNANIAEVLVGEDWLRTHRIWLSLASQRLYVAMPAPSQPRPSAQP